MTRRSTPHHETQAEDPIAYVDNEALVVCDRNNPNAWIRSDTSIPVESDPETVKNRDATVR